MALLTSQKEPMEGMVSFDGTRGSIVLTNANLHAEKDEDGNQGGEKGSKPDGNDFMAERICELRIDNLAVLEVDWK